MKLYIAFPSLNNWLTMEYTRDHRAQLSALWSGNTSVRAAAYTSYNSKMILATVPTKPWRVVLFELIQGQFREVWASVPSTLNSVTVTVPTLSFLDGRYFIGSDADSTLTQTILIKNTKGFIPDPYEIAIFPDYMSAEWGVGAREDDSYPTLSEPIIIPWLGVRPPVQSSVPFGASKPLTARLPREKLWHQYTAEVRPQKSYQRVPSTTPWGSVIDHHPMRYGVESYDDINPIHAIAGDSIQAALSPTDDMDGYPADASIGLLCSGFQHPDTFEWWGLNPNGRILKIGRDRKVTTVSGWKLRDGALHPVNWDKAATLGEKQAFFDKSHVCKGAGPDLWRAWGMCLDNDNPNRAFVAATGDHTIVSVDLTTGDRTYLAGTPNVAGRQDGLNAKFDMPRGVIHLRKGPHAGKVFVCAEHTSSCGVFDLKTGEYKTLFQALRVPDNPAVQLGYNQPLDTKLADGTIKPGLRSIWGMPGPIGTIQNLDNCQFVHPCQAAELSDGRIAIAHHDAYQISIVDLTAGTMEYFADYPIMGTRTDALPRAWPTIFADRTGAFGGLDDIFACTWFQSAEIWIDQNHVRHSFTAGGFLVCEGPGDMTQQSAYPRVLIPGVNGELLYNGDDTNCTKIIRAKLINDPKLDQPRYERGVTIYKTEGALPNGGKRAALQLSHGPSMQHYWGGLKCGAELAALDQAQFNTYWRNFGAIDLTDVQLSDMRYFAMWSSADGLQRLREGLVV